MYVPLMTLTFDPVKPKMYSILFSNDTSDRRAKGIGRSVTKKELTHEKYVKICGLLYMTMCVTPFLCPPSKKRGYIVLLMSVGLSVGRSVCRSVDQLVSANYLGIQLSQGSHILCGAWSW